MSQPKTFEIVTASGRARFKAITALSVIRCLTVIKDETTDPVTRKHLQIVIDLIHDSRPTI